MAESYSVTSAGVNPAEDRTHRMRMYFIAMALRVVCVASLFWLRDWWVLLAAAGAIFLPWFAVMVGNAVAHSVDQPVDAPDPLQLESGEPEVSTDSPADMLLVVDVDPERRGSGGTAEPESPESTDSDSDLGEPQPPAQGIAQ
ncbi:DUF3099 domain-containing protein [Leucobacter coleopterorum]|uniref:DUF3099 domain-containing protein n=1 Tax=Leucobacter coleopterorum TaxID=2714933 RepID=A0ABX6JVV4_9MICO|nr:DUF3099 domain-containing protein [Leucobacter coleopterorum]QIM18430.1 DUF3099 domain-containing protein [Leucobacter coleopterorum]